MEDHSLEILSNSQFSNYMQQAPANMQAAFDALKDAEISNEKFSFYTSVSAMASSKIEGEQLEIDSYVKHKMLNTEYQPDLVQKPDDLYSAYLFAQKNELTQKTFLLAHTLITKHLLRDKKQGILRTGNMVVMEHNTGRIQYEAAPANQLQSLFNTLWQDIETLKNNRLLMRKYFISLPLYIWYL
jgi:hypothetical protein